MGAPQQMLLGAVSVIAAAVIWSNTNKSTFITVSGSGLQVQSPSDGNPHAGLCDTAFSGKKYYEDFLSASATVNNNVGLANASLVYNSFSGFDTNSIGYYGNGQVFYNNTLLTTAASYVAGNTICWAVDVPNGKFWVRVNGGNWNNDPAANPATNTNGLPISVAGTIFPAYQVADVTAIWITNFGATTYGFTAPAGFGNL